MSAAQNRFKQARGPLGGQCRRLGGKRGGHLMTWASGSDFFAMGGYGVYVWGSLGMCAVVIVAELVLLKLRRATLLR